MKYKHIQAAHEARMWIKDVIIPAVGAGIIIAANPETRRVAGDVINGVKNKATKVFKKKEKKES